MNRNEVIDLLTIIVSYDKRTVGESDIAAWGEAARRGGWTYPEAVEAVHAFHLESTDLVKPAHVHRALRTARRNELERAAVPAQTSDPALMRRLEAFADAKAIDGPRAQAPTRQLTAVPATRGEVTIAAAMRRGEQLRRDHDERQGSR